MTSRVYHWICGATMLVSACGTAVGAARWLGSAELVRALEPLGRMPLFVGTVGVVCVYAVVQSLPGGREPVWIVKPPNEGWMLALLLAALCATLAAHPLTPGGSLDVLVSAPNSIIAALFFLDRHRRVQRRLAESP